MNRTTFPPRPGAGPRARTVATALGLSACVWGVQAQPVEQAPRPATPAPSAAGGEGRAAQAAGLVPVELHVGGQHELVFPAGVERLAIADDTIAHVTVTRRQPGSPAARLVLAARAPGSTSLMVWEKGMPAAHRYTLRVRRPPAVLEGRYPDAAAHARARGDALARQADNTALDDRSVIDVRSHTVQVDVKVVEFNRTTLKQMGLNLFSTRANSHGFSFGLFSPGGLRESAMGGDGSLSGTYERPLAQALNLLFNFGRAGIGAHLGLLEGHGLARVLAEPTLVSMSGQSASFLAGGELPIPVPQGLGTTSIEYKAFGVGLSVTPTVLSNERIALKVAPEASDLDFTNALSFNGVVVPAITTRRADTTVELGDGESFIIGGLVSRTTASNVDKVPLLGDLPVLGTFFKQSSYQLNERELVIVVTPHLVRPLARGTDLNARLPGAGEQPDAPVWRQMLLGGASDTVVPGFSR